MLADFILAGYEVRTFAGRDFYGRSNGSGSGNGLGFGFGGGNGRGIGIGYGIGTDDHCDNFGGGYSEGVLRKSNPPSYEVRHAR